MKKILITGNAGSGKTTLTSQLAKILNRTDLISLDKIVWKPGWLLTEKNEREMTLEKIAQEKSWIVDGVSKTILGKADTIIFLDYPRYVCYWRAFCRNRKYLFKSRPELPEKCPEIRFLKKLIQIIWKFQRDVRPTILKYLNENAETKKIFHVTNNKQLQSVIAHCIEFSDSNNENLNIFANALIKSNAKAKKALQEAELAASKTIKILSTKN